MCEKCLYKKNCQFLAKHKKSVVENCTAFLSEDEYKAEAIKEFAERLKEKMLHVEDEGQIFKMVHCYEIDNLVKEMVGENK